MFVGRQSSESTFADENRPDPESDDQSIQEILSRASGDSRRATEIAGEILVLLFNKIKYRADQGFKKGLYWMKKSGGKSTKGKLEELVRIVSCEGDEHVK